MVGKVRPVVVVARRAQVVVALRALVVVAVVVLAAVFSLAVAVVDKVHSKVLAVVGLAEAELVVRWALRPRQRRARCRWWRAARVRTRTRTSGW